MKFNELLDAIVRWLWDDENAIQKLSSWRINFADWPRGEAREAAEFYERLRSEKGHTYAAIRTEEEYKRRISDTTKLPDQHTLCRLYFEAVNQAAALELGKMLIKYPDRGQELAQSVRWLKPSGDISHFGSIVDQVQKQNLENEKAGKSVVEIPGWPVLSNMIGGFNPGRVGLLVANTGFGKTNLAASLALDASETLSTLFCNMEMITHDFAEKLVMGAGEITYRQIRTSPSHFPEIFEEVQAKHINRRLFFTDGSTLSVWDLNQMVLNMKEKHEIDLLIVDYDQKIELKTSKEMPEWKALQVAVESLEKMAKEHRIYCLLLAQAADDGDGKSKGRVSGSRRSTFPASTVLNFHRDEDADGAPYLIEAVKNRFGPRGATIEVSYRPEVSRVKEKGIYEAGLYRSNPTGTASRNSNGVPRPAWYNSDN